MATRKKQKMNKKIVAIIVVLILVVVVVLAILISKRKNSPKTPEEFAQIEIKYQEDRNEQIKKSLYEKSEQERVQFYCSSFFKLISSKNYEEAYKLLNSDYKENYFPTLTNFKKYFEDYFPLNIALDYKNFERLGDIYILTVNVKDTVNGSYGHNFTMYVVIKENAVNEYELSFSRNSAVEEE